MVLENLLKQTTLSGLKSN